jgi:hypothetical protein
MPIAPTSKVLTRAVEIESYIRQKRCATTAMVTSDLGITHTKAFYVLRNLARLGKVRQHVIGKVSVWCAPDVRDAALVYTTAMPCFAFAGQALWRLLEGYISPRASIRASKFVKELGKLCKRLPTSENAPVLLVMAKSYLADVLGPAVIEEREGVFRVDVNKARELISNGALGGKAAAVEAV